MGRRLFDYSSMSRREQAGVMVNIALWSVLSYLLFSRFVLGATLIVGSSMAPSLHDGERLIIDRLSPRLRAPARGAVVVFRVPRYEGLSVKRVVALPREVVQIRDGRVIVNGRALREPYLAPGTVTEAGGLSSNVFVVADGCYFVLGDNRSRSVDSRSFGAIERGWIEGILPRAGREAHP